jgi:hypothetical protein
VVWARGMIATVIAITIATANGSSATITDGVTTGLHQVPKQQAEVRNLVGPRRFHYAWPTDRDEIVVLRTLKRQSQRGVRTIQMPRRFGQG